MLSMEVCRPYDSDLASKSSQAAVEPVAATNIKSVNPIPSAQLTAIAVFLSANPRECKRKRK